MSIASADLRSQIHTPPPDTTVVLGLRFAKMTKYDYYAFAGAGPNAMIQYDDEFIRIWDPDEMTIHEYPNNDTLTDEGVRIWSLSEL